MPPTALPRARIGGQHNTAEYQAYLLTAVTDDALMADALRLYEGRLADALAVHHSANPLALVNVRLRWMLHRVGRLLAMLDAA